MNRYLESGKARRNGQLIGGGEPEVGAIPGTVDHGGKSGIHGICFGPGNYRVDCTDNE